ncbi:hypothetical protein Scep_018948 [Stephania cephalantha]|uniref:Uncharacterized protein n=1 Tax=Stephania cephalantha TaxID=152367 RepID=A0AAP0NMD3_9MAGN
MLAKLQRRRREATSYTGTPVDDEAVYYNVAGECLRGHVYSLWSLGRKKRIYAYPGASTSQISVMVPRLEFDTVVEQLRQVVAFMQRQFGMTMDGAGLSQPQPPPPPHEQKQPPQTNPVIHHNNRTMLIGRCKIGLREMSSLVILSRDKLGNTKLRHGIETNQTRNSCIPLLISNGLDKEFMISVVDPLLISNGSETEYN